MCVEREHAYRLKPAYIMTYTNSVMDTKNTADSLYRVSLKAVIRDADGKVLVVKEARDSHWNLPGGGMDHGETINQGLKRELYEELLITSPFTAKLIDTELIRLASRPVWQLSLFYVVVLENFEYGAGQDAGEVACMDPGVFKDSEHRGEQRIYKFARL